MSIQAYFTNRVYKNALTKEYVKAIEHALIVFNRAKQFAFSTSIKEKRSGKCKRSKSMHLTVKSRFNLDDYYANSVVQEAKAIQSSLTELNKMYVSNKETQIDSVKNKIKKEKSRMTTLTKAKASFVIGKPSFAKNSNMKKVGNFFLVSYKKKTDLYDHAYQFEHEYLDKEMKRIRTKIGFLTFKKNMAQWGYVTKMLKGIRTCAYYQSDLFDMARFRSTNDFFTPEALTDLESKSLSKLKSGKTAS